jgi:hypothetical protein
MTPMTPVTPSQVDPWSADEAAEPFEFVAVADGGPAGGRCPAAYRDRLVVHTLHDGHVIPQRLLDRPCVDALVADGSLARDFARARDWGANLVAEHLAAALGLGGYHRVNVARVVMDFNRFPGSSPAQAGPLDRFAISQPMSDCLDHQDKRWVLERFYDAVSARMERAIDGKLIVLSIHTYDEHNHSLTQRPEVSLLSRSHSYQLTSRLPYGVFDPLFPDVLVESSAKRILRDRIALTLEKQGLAVEHNYPYCLPDGSLEIRSQPWYFFRHLRLRYEQDRPETREDAAHTLIWDMLLNTNLRRGVSGTLSGYLHRFRAAPAGREREFDEARQAYERIGRWLTTRPELVDRYRRSEDRTSALSIEVRKDLVWRFDGAVPVGPQDAAARRIAGVLAQAITTYLVDDRA